MSTKLITTGVWKELTKAAKSARKPCHVAVAYFSEGADRLLPLPSGSRLVVNANERVVAAGQTCPTTLERLLEKGVKIYSVENLHAKVFVIGETAYVGSSNASWNSERRLVEVVVRSNDAGVVRSARKLVEGLCLSELTPGALARLAGIYVPPKFPHGKGRKRVAGQTTVAAEIAPLRIVRLRDVEWSEWDQENIDKGEAEAERSREHGEGFRLDHFKWAGNCAVQEGDAVIRILTERDGRAFVYPPASVIKKDVRKRDGKLVSYLFVEGPDRRRRRFSTWVRKLGSAAEKKVGRSGVVKDAALVRKLLRSWEG
ncbi:phospholipase D-like domain-containing protein [Haloferula sp. A504]|uniref:phospholipase D-like domain-containing protein n=1 Tax=Haloferula sp. A504 TaxID=3373601 RepID=UPI0031BC56EA|nr:phospholipase D-like domain-containing protein [Verrucomicrobiaceae bacterium E54]